MSGCRQCQQAMQRAKRHIKAAELRRWLRVGLVLALLGSGLAGVLLAYQQQDLKRAITYAGFGVC
jgi:hypothetical protein